MRFFPHTRDTLRRRRTKRTFGAWRKPETTDAERKSALSERVSAAVKDKRDS
jgi:hypothetical protein